MVPPLQAPARCRSIFVVSTALATGLLRSGSISYIYYADRLNQLPLGLIGIGLGTILLPTISRQLGQNREAEAMDTQNRGIELALFLTLPATIASVFAVANRSSAACSSMANSMRSDSSEAARRCRPLSRSGFRPTSS